MAMNENDSRQDFVAEGPESFSPVEAGVDSANDVGMDRLTNDEIQRLSLLVGLGESPEDVSVQVDESVLSVWSQLRGHRTVVDLVGQGVHFEGPHDMRFEYDSKTGAITGVDMSKLRAVLANFRPNDERLAS